MSASPRATDHGSRVVAGIAVRITELVWPDLRRSYEVHLADGDVDLTKNGRFDDPPTDTQISDLLAEHHATTPSDVLRELVNAAGARVGWQVDLDQLPVTCAHTPHLVVDLVDACAAYLAALATHAALTDAARSVQAVITASDPGTVDWFAAGLLGTIAQLANSRNPQLGHTRRALIATLRALQQEGAAWPPDPTQPALAQPTPAGPAAATGSSEPDQ